MNTWAEIKQAFMSMSGGTKTYSPFFTEAQALAWANRALRDMGQYCWYRDAAVERTVGATSETVNVGNVIRVWRAEAEESGVMKGLSSTRKDDLLREHRYWYNTRGTIRKYYLDMVRSGSFLSVGLYPIPQAETDMRFYCYVYPDEVSDASPSDEIDIPEWAVAGVLYYMLGQAYASDSKIQDFGIADFWVDLYLGIRENLKDLALGKVSPLARLPMRHRNKTDVRAQAPEYITGTV